ncbi:MAG: hypothetical protein ACRCSG_03140 [Cellulosilyticaceae bacterium]
MARKKKEPFVDDGRTIANMNVPGMPWHLDGPKVPTIDDMSTKKEHIEELQLTKKERRAMIRGVMMAVMPITFIFVVGYFIIFLFIHFVWLS